MKCKRKTLKSKNHKFVLLNFSSEKDDAPLSDEVIRRKLRPVSQKEFRIFCSRIFGLMRKERRIAAFGNIARGPYQYGSFPGVPYINTRNYQVKVLENWTRGDNEWGDGWEFVFVPKTTENKEMRNE